MGLRPKPPQPLRGDPITPRRGCEARCARHPLGGAAPQTPAAASRGPHRPTPRLRGALCAPWVEPTGGSGLPSRLGLFARGFSENDNLERIFERLGLVTYPGRYVQDIPLLDGHLPATD